MLLLSNESEFNEFIIKALIEIKELFGWQRRTQIYEDEFDLSYEETDLIKDESTYLGISRN
ncbi:hypothetical protein NW067_04765 [Mycoplasmopsis cynos]|nr:hypothetical protein [Mycoplasmopsis cynos]UWV82299.1 hypothetical protein NW067_04765 [Mycoplasmopsis cynos]